MIMQRLIRAIYPAQCVACEAHTDSDHGLCAPCWAQTHFINGLVCDGCGTPMLGDSDDGIKCDDCLRIARPWVRGRAAMVYSGTGRRLVLGLKHGDRLDLVKPAGAWMARVTGPLIAKDTMLVPVPLHWTRMLKRRYNQAAELAKALGREVSRPVILDGLIRPRATKPLEGHSRVARFEALSEAIEPHPDRVQLLQGRSILLVDDVMTSGATLAAATQACHAAGAENVSIVTLARVVKDA